MGEFFQSNTFFRPLYKHRKLPVYITDEFNFFRCVEFHDDFYGKNVSNLHEGNIRESIGRYSKLFPGQRISYWADSPETARAEVKVHGASKNLITFWAYDDYSSSFPCMGENERLMIIDGRKCGIQELICKIENGINISKREREYIYEILEQKPDCLVYDSVARKGGENFIFLEKGFRKLAIREVRLRLGERAARNEATITCAVTSDYAPLLQNYGCYFEPIAKIRLDKKYFYSREYRLRTEYSEMWLKKIKSST